MFLPFFEALRKHAVPVSLREFLSFLDAMRAGLATYDVEAFYYLARLTLVKDELGDRWLKNDLFRFGASSLLGDIERQLEHYVTGRYSAGYRHPIG